MHEGICSRRPSCELQFLQNKAVNRLDNFRRHTLIYKLYVALKKLDMYYFTTEVCRQHVEVI